LLGASSSAPLVGSALANFLGFTLKKCNPSSIVVWTKSIFLICLTLTLIQESYILIPARFVIGICLGFQFPVITSIIYEVTPKNLRTRVGNLISVMFSAGLMLGFALSALVTLKIIDWMVYFVIIIGIAFLDILIIFFYLKKDIGVYYMYENNYPKSKIK
jgi:MFS family permease